MLDPLTALGVAAAVVQFVDFGSRLLTEGYATYTSPNGAPQEDMMLQDLALDLESLSSRLATNRTSGHGSASEQEMAIQNLARKCSEIAKSLSDVLEELKVKSTGLAKGFDAVSRAVRRALKKERIETLMRQLDAMKLQLNSHLLAALGDQQSKIAKTLDEILEQNMETRIDAKNQLQQIKDEIISTLRSQELQPDSRDNTRSPRRVSNAVRHDWSRYSAQKEYLSDDKAKQTPISLTDLSHMLEAIRSMAAEYATSQKILESLGFKEMYSRHAAIHDAYFKTYDWIFEEARTPFRTWLESDADVFWITGKPGSGKSTLMKYLNRHPSTRQILESAVTNNQKIVMAYHYLWNPGQNILKNKEGLLRSILFQILQQCSYLIPKLFPRRWAAGGLHSSQMNRPWNLEELSDSIETIISDDTLQLDTKFCFFVDGLDEYDGSDDSSHGDLVGDLIKMSRSTHVKLCVSSRPWTEFSDSFADKTRMLVMENLTKDDMERYVRGLLGENRGFRDLVANGSGTDDLIEEILEKAQGVFLWVYLVVRSLLRGLDKHDEISLLHRRLQELPAGLESLFDHMLGSIERPYRHLTARALQMLEQGHELRLATFCYLPLEDANQLYVLEKPIEKVPSSTAMKMAQQATWNANAWCRDLLVVNEPPPSSRIPVGARFLLDVKVDPMHRTVQEFIAISRVSIQLSRWIPTTFDTRWTALATLLFQAKTLPDVPNSSTLDDVRLVAVLANRISTTARMRQCTGLRSVVDLLDCLDAVGAHYNNLTHEPNTYHYHWTNRFERPSYRMVFQSSFLIWAILVDLIEYIDQKLDASSELLDPRSRSSPGLLDFALGIIYSPHHFVEMTPSEPLIACLLDHGANLNGVTLGDKSGNTTPWQRYMSYRWQCHTRANLSDTAAESEVPNEEPRTSCPTIRFLLERGADTTVRIHFPNHGPYTCSATLVRFLTPSDYKRIMKRVNQTTAANTQGAYVRDNFDAMNPDPDRDAYDRAFAPLDAGQEPARDRKHPSHTETRLAHNGVKSRIRRLFKSRSSNGKPSLVESI